MNYRLFFMLALLIAACSSDNSPSVSIKRDKGLLNLTINGQDALSYQYETLYPPQGVDSIFKRSGFIHPIKTLKGHALTRIFPEDHYHHFGVWNPWTHTLFEGDTIDFWNIGKGQATVRFAGFKKMDSTKNSYTFQALHEHVVFTDSLEKIVLNELHQVTTTIGDNSYYTIDFQFDYACATDSPFEILQYRYGGFGFRATKNWTDSTSRILTSEGITRDGADGSRARWCIAQGVLGEDYGGLVLMSHPNNYNHPEPLRIWPPHSKEDGNVFINIAPTKTKNWLFEPNNTYTLKYRLVVFDGEITSEQAEEWWELYK